MARHIKPMDEKEETNLWKILSKEDEETGHVTWVSEPDKDMLLLNCYFYSLFSCVEATTMMYECIDAEKAKFLKKRRAAFMRTLKWIVRYHDLSSGLGEEF